MLYQGSDSLSPSSNPYSWNNNANMLFFESPPGVGFSINEDKGYEFNDSRTAVDNVKALKVWFDLFPEYSNNSFWLAGESYCGMYIPLFADELLKSRGSFDVNFEGMMIGNGVMLTELHWRRKARNTFFSRHYFLNPEIQSLISNCEYN